MRTYQIYALLLLGAVACKNPREIDVDSRIDNDNPYEIVLTDQTATSIADASGVQNWKNVSEIKFTFNSDRNGNHLERAWTWNPKSNDVQLIFLKDTINYNRSNLDSIALGADAAFINDKYWMLAPFQLVWDKGMEFFNEEKAIAPISNKTMARLTIVYPNEGGYTPGDAYDFFYDTNYVIREWNYRRANADKPSATTTWEDYQDFDGIKIATKHRNVDGILGPYFTNISIKYDKK